MVGVTWYEAAAYANWLAALTGLPSRLPTEAEWEIAERSAGEACPGRAQLGHEAPEFSGWPRHGPPRPGGRLSPGHHARPELHDLTSNVWEWMATLLADYP